MDRVFGLAWRLFFFFFSFEFGFRGKRVERMSRDTGYGESKRALAANISCACCFGAFFRASALAIHLVVVAAFRATRNPADRVGDRWSVDPTGPISLPGLTFRILRCGERAERSNDRSRSAAGSMSGGAKVTWSPHTCAYNRKRSLCFHSLLRLSTKKH